MRKIAKVVKILFGTAVKKYTSFFVLEAFKTVVQIGMPFVGILLTPLIVDEVCGARDVNRLIRLAAVLIVRNVYWRFCRRHSAVRLTNIRSGWIIILQCR